MTERDLQEHLGRMPERHDVRLHDLLFDEAVTCVDGRKPDCIVGAPGGNAGLFVLLAAALEEVGGEPLTDEAVRALFDAYLERFGHFYLHTDAPALARLGVVLHGDPAFVPYATASREDVEAFVRRPPADVRDALRPLLAEPEHVGCGHLRLIAEHPDAYRVRPGLLRAFWRSYYDALWEGDARVTLDVLAGDHREEAVVSVVAEAGAVDDTLGLPALRPHHDGLQLFVAHPQAMSYLFREHAAFAEAQGLVGPAARAGLVEAQERLAAHQLAVTLSHLAAGLPRFEVTFGADGASVSRAGVGAS